LTEIISEGIGESVDENNLINSFLVLCTSPQLHWRNELRSSDYVDSSGLVMYYRDTGVTTYRPLHATTALFIVAVHFFAFIAAI